MAQGLEETPENNFKIDAGLNVSRVVFKTDLVSQSKKSERHAKSTGFGLSTYAGYRFNAIELSVGSDALFGGLHNMTFQVPSGPVSGNGSFRIFSITPLLRYYTPYFIKFFRASSAWNVYMSAGPTWSLHTFIISKNSAGSDFSESKRINFENRGGSLNLGLMEVLPYKNQHPAFIELGYSYMRSDHIYIVDASDFKDVKTLSRDASKDFYGHYFTLRFGITLF